VSDINISTMSDIGGNATVKDKNRQAIVLSMSTKNMTEKEKTAVVTGSASGIGFETSLLLARNGFHTFATVRDLDKAKAIKEISDKGELPITVIELDVTSDKSVSGAIDKIINEEGKRIDALVNNAGYGQGGALEDDSMDEIKSLFETNLFGAIRVMKAVLPIMRKQQGGTIVNVSSMGGRIGLPFGTAYHGTKFALEGISESMRYETEPFGIKVVLIEPGIIRSNFLSNAKVGQKTVESSSPYAPKFQTYLKAAARAYDQATPPEEVAKAILKAVTIDNPELRYVVGNDAIQMIEAKKGMSDQEFGRVVEQRLLAP
jgi:NAD(P)-dependent dehydrogenase (short-subunit alcohol dehydrogenase family)